MIPTAITGTSERLDDEAEERRYSYWGRPVITRTLIEPYDELIGSKGRRPWMVLTRKEENFEDNSLSDGSPQSP